MSPLSKRGHVRALQKDISPGSRHGESATRFHDMERNRSDSSDYFLR
jgi:hypothetical protein